MKKILSIFLLLFALISSNGFSQNSFTLPDGYRTYKDFDGKESRADGDFDGDGVSDLAIVCADNNDSKIIVVYLGSKWLVDQSYWWFPWDYYSKLSFSNNVLTIDSGDGEFINVILKLKHYSNLSNMKLIGYARDEYMRALNPDNGTTEIVKVNSKNINLNTGEYQVDGGIKKKINISTITLSDIEKYFVYLSQVGSNN